MKSFACNQSRRRALALAIAMVLVRAGAPAADLVIDWWTVDGGGGTSSGGAYAVTGTVGQPDAGAMTGGAYAVVGGFWALPALVQSEGAPLLTMTHGPTPVVTLSWPWPATGWILQTTTSNLSAGTPWANIPAPYATNGTTSIFVVQPITAGNRFYRLYKP